MKFLLSFSIIDLLLLNGDCCYFSMSPTVRIKMDNNEQAGMHRKLKYTVEFYEKILSQNCEYMISQPLPAAVYISTDELDDFRRMNKLSAVYPKFIDIEAFTAKAKPFTVLLRGSTKDLTLPIHFRYHAASKYRTTTTVNISSPKLYLSCQNEHNRFDTDKLYCLNLNKSDFEEDLNSEKSKGCLWQQVSEGHSSRELLRVMIPVGDANGFTLVFYVTISLTWTASIWTVLRIHLVTTRIQKT